MDVPAVATAAISVLSPYLSEIGKSLAQEAGKQLPRKITELYNAIREKFKGDDYAEQTLARAENKPDSRSRLEALKGVLMEKMETDSDFAAIIYRLTLSGTPEEGRIFQQMNVTGTVGNAFQIGRINGGHVVGHKE